MNKIVPFALSMLVIGLVACANSAPAPAAAPALPSTASARKSGTIRMSMIGTPNVKDIPRLMAIDSLKEQGYDVEMTNFAQSELIPAAMERGDIDIGDSTTNQAWTAITKGLDIRSVVGEANITFYLVTKQNIQTCRDMDGRAIVFSNRTSIGYLMFEDYIKQNCPGASPQIVLITNSNNRIASLQSGSVDGAYIEIEDWLVLDRQAPGRFRIAINYAKEFPQIQFSTFTARRLWAQQNPGIVQDFVRELLVAHRRVVGHPDTLRDEIAKYFSTDPAQAQEWAAAFAAADVWDVNGALTTQNLQFTIDYLAVKSSFPSNIKITDVADLSYLNAVLGEIGRQ
jgi:ABC-type nitrate/sulfonate/bicarbonate transport system substrate-binding protein